MDNSPNPKQRNFVVGLIIIGLLIIVFFGLRTVRAFREFHGHRPPPPFATKPAETDADLIRDWMTIPFLSKMYHVPPSVIFDSLGIPPQSNQEKSLKQLNEEYYPQTPGIVLEMVKAAVRAALPEAPPLAPLHPNTPVP
jgi:hypothetical protein